MIKKIKQFTGILFVLFSTVILFVSILLIWDVINSQMAKEIFTKILYTFGVIFVISLALISITKKKD